MRHGTAEKNLNALLYVYTEHSGCSSELTHRGLDNKNDNNNKLTAPKNTQ